MQTDNQPTMNPHDDQLLENVVHFLLHEAREGADERRMEYRQPYFTPVRISFAQDAGRQFSCFSRDVSATGMGLLHCMPVEPGEVVLSISSESFGDLRIRSKIVWCRPCGEGWYMSGARFIELSARRS